ncbi:hypothetical protein L1857_31595 [Amycolatopsis thermalba]|uniref:Uncharacterized protein n=1 Tax=Amycolatopsis thermalba TaxID=944492 RepID=A0ABY4P3U5_9PSEU|nr:MULTISPECIES: hypothetical protein [Amycolatopsis]UQS27022.1 hypothetical protein L1857_31595 [Amycolatopsis thermalba]
MNLEDELSRLFSDERLDVPVRPGAELLVVAGARRRRYRRNAAVATGGALTMVALIAVGITLSGIGGGRTDTLPATNLPVTTIASTPGPESGAPLPPTSSSAPPQSSSTGVTSVPSVPGSHSASRSTPRSSSVPAGPAQRPGSTDPTIGPSGWGRLALGMSEADAVASDEFDMTEGYSGSPCHRYWLKGGGSPVDISPTYGVARISAKPGVTTPEGVGVGSTDAEVMAAYPNATTANYLITAPVPGNPDAVYLFNTDPSQKIFSLRLELASHHC